MDFSINNLLANFADDKLVAPKALEKKLGCEDPSGLKQLEIALDALEKIGVLTKERGKYRRLSEEGVVEGKLRCSSKGFCFAIQDQEESEDIYVRESQLSNAWNGDRVLIKVTKEGRRRRSPEGEVKLILERGNPSVIARVKQTERGLRGVPLDDRLLFELELQPSELVADPASVLEQLVHVEILRYPLGDYLPQGAITRVLGNDAESADDNELVCCKYDLNRGFNESTLQAAAAIPSKLKKTDFKNRLDFRKHLTLTLSTGHPEATIQGFEAAATELMDCAFSLQASANGLWQLGIHIADVSQFVEPDTPLDREANRRGMAVPLADNVIPLFPPNLMALTPDQERLTLSILVTLSATGEVLEYELQPSVIRVGYNVTAQEVTAILNGQGEALYPHLSDVYTVLEQLQTVSQVLQQQRQGRGSFELQLPINHLLAGRDEGLLGAMAVPEQGQARAIVAEVAVLANQIVMSHLQSLGLPAIYRVQSPPELYQVQEFIKLTGNLGISLGLSQEETVQPQDYQTFAQQIAQQELTPLLMKLLLETLSNTTSSAVAGPHFGLAVVQGYGHFTAPLHRYSDLLNQRVVKAIFLEGRDRRTARAKEVVNLRHSNCLGQVSWNVLPPETQRDLELAIAASLPHLNEREHIAQQSLKDLNGLQKVKQMQSRTGELFKGIITGIQSYGFFVDIETLMVEGLVHVSSLKDDWYEYRSRQQILIGRKNHRQYRLGDQVEVQVKNVDYYRQQIDLLVIGGGSQATDEEFAEANEPEHDRRGHERGSGGRDNNRDNPSRGRLDSETADRETDQETVGADAELG
jgi:ribonuclease R